MKEVNEDNMYKYYWDSSTSSTTLTIASVSADTTYTCKIGVSSNEYTKTINIDVLCKFFI